jgi:hypothetical protein
MSLRTVCTSFAKASRVCLKRKFCSAICGLLDHPSNSVSGQKDHGDLIGKTFLPASLTQRDGRRDFGTPQSVVVVSLTHPKWKVKSRSEADCVGSVCIYRTHESTIQEGAATAFAGRRQARTHGFERHYHFISLCSFRVPY